MSAASGNGASEPVSSGNGAHEPPSFGNGAGPAAAADLAASAPPMRPEVAVGAAFAGGFLLAMLLRRVRS